MTNHDFESEPAAFGACRPDAALARKIEWARQTSFSGSLYFLSSLMRKIALRTIGNGRVDYEFRGMNVRFTPNGNTAEKRALLNPARFDHEELTFIETCLPPGGIFLDVGANVGLYSLVAAKAAGPEGRVLAFEPNPAIMERLAFNVACNRDDARMAPIDLIEKAVTGINGPVGFATPSNNLGEGRVLTGDDEETGNLTVSGTRLEDCLTEFGIPKSDIMKVDIEGHEVFALEPFLKSAPVSLHPTYMIVERGADDHWKPLADLFRSTGYEPRKSCRMNEIWQKQ